MLFFFGLLCSLFWYEVPHNSGCLLWILSGFAMLPSCGSALVACSVYLLLSPTLSLPFSPYSRSTMSPCSDFQLCSSLCISLSTCTDLALVVIFVISTLALQCMLTSALLWLSELVPCSVCTVPVLNLQCVPALPLSCF